MSYDITLFKKLENKTEEESYIFFCENEEIGGLTDQEYSLQKQKIQDEFDKEFPWLKRYGNNDPDESLMLQEDSSGITVEVFRDQIAINVPYWESNVPDIYEKISSIVKTLQKITSYSMYDGQFETSDFGSVDKESFLKLFVFGEELIANANKGLVENKAEGLALDTKVWIVGIVIVVLGFILQIKALFAVGLLVGFFGGNVLPFFIKER